MRLVKLGFVTICGPSFLKLLICTICWASSSQRRRSSVGWSAGTMPWSGASWTNMLAILKSLPRLCWFILKRLVNGQSNNGADIYLLFYLTAELLNFMKHLVEIFIELFQLKHCGSIPLLEVKVNRHRVWLLNTKTQSQVQSGRMHTARKHFKEFVATFFLHYNDITSFSASVFISFKCLMCSFLIMRILDNLV